MSTGSLDILKNRVQSAVQETKILRDENERLKAQLNEATAKGGRTLGNPGAVRYDRLIDRGFDIEDVRKRLQGLLGRIDRLEKRLHTQER